MTVEELSANAADVLVAFWMFITSTGAGLTCLVIIGIAASVYVYGRKA